MSFRDSQHPYPFDVTLTLHKLVNGVNTRPEIRKEVRLAWERQDKAMSHVEAWDANAALHDLCWKYC